MGWWGRASRWLGGGVVLALLIGAAPAPRTSPLGAAPAPRTSPLAAADTARSPAAAPAQITPLRFGATQAVSNAGIFVARARGYFREQGLDVEYVPAQGGSDTIAPLASGDLELAGGAVSPGLFNAYDRGIRMRMVADKGISRPGFEFTQLVVRKDLLDSGEVRDLADLRGRRIGMASTRSGVESLVARILAGGGVGFAEVDPSVMSASDALVALGNRAIDANITIEPVLSAGVDRGVAATWEAGRSSAAYGGVYQAAVLLFSERFAAQPEAARRFMVAYLRGVRAYNDAFTRGEGRAEVVRILTEETPVKDPALYERMHMAGLDPNGRIARQSVQLDLEYFRQNGLYTGATTLDDVLDPS